MDDPIDEFSFLSDQAADIGVTGPLPRVERLTHTLGDGRVVSALRYGDGPPVVTLLHGAGLNAHTWDTTVLALDLPALAIDLPGHGDSSWRDDAAYVPRVLAPDVADAMDAWTTTPQVLVGQSLGGLTAAALAASRPDLVRELVVIDISPGIDQNGNARQIGEFFAGPSDWATREELVERALSFGLGGSPRAATRGVTLNSRIRPDGRVEWKHHFAQLANRGARAAALDGTGWDDLTAVSAPLTLVRGDRGFLTDDDAADYARRLPAASVVTVPSGHNVQEEMPRALGERLRDLARTG